MMPTACAVPELINQPWRRGSGGRTQLAGPHNGKRRRRDRGGHNKASAQSRMAASATVASTRCHGPLVSTSNGIPTDHRIHLAEDNLWPERLQKPARDGKLV